MVRGGNFLGLVVDFEQRWIGEPHELELALAGEPELFADVQTNRAQAGVGHLGFVGHEQEQVSGLRARDAIHFYARFVGEALGERCLPGAAILHARKGNALDAERLGEFGEAVEHGARKFLGAVGGGDAQAFDDAAAGDCAVEHAETRSAGRLGHVAQHEVEAQVGFIDAVLIHRFGERHATQGQLHFDAEHFAPQLGDEALHDGL